MKKLILCFALLILTSTVTLSQSNEKTDNSNYVLVDKITHEELRKNIEDYKLLIAVHDKLKAELTTLKSDSKIDAEKIAYYQKQILELQDKILNLNRQILNLQEALDKSKRELATKSELYNDLKRIHYRDQAKIYSMKNYQRRYQIQGVVIGFLAITVLVLVANGN